MTKTKKRRRHDHHQSTSLSSLQVVGINQGGGGIGSVNNNNSNSIESCLEELEALSGVRNVEIQQQQQEAATSPLVGAGDDYPREPTLKKVKTENESSAGKLQHEKLWDPSLANTSKNNSNSLFSKEIQRKAHHWNAALLQWTKSGTYTSNVLPSLEVEVSRHFQVEKLSSWLLKSCKEIKMPAFERWLMDSKLDEQQQQSSSNNHTISDPVLNFCQPQSPATRRLAQEMGAAGISAAQVKKTIQELCRRCEVAVEELCAQTRQYANKIPLKHGNRIELEQHDQIYTLIYRCKAWKKPFCIRVAAKHYQKLREMFLHVHNNNNNNNNNGETIQFVQAGKATKALHAFHYLTMVLLLRYSSLSGGQLLMELRGGGMQGAIHGEVFRVLRQYFCGRHNNINITGGGMLECFASPLNAYLPRFGSAYFADLDWHFGSVGNILELDTTTLVDSECCCEANPPFSAGIMTAMVDRIEQALQQANEKKKSLVFVVVVPTVAQNEEKGEEDNSDSDDNSDKNKDKNKSSSSSPTTTPTIMAMAKRHALPSFQRMTSSPHCTHHIVLPAREHGYIEGAQHLRLTRYKSSIFDTSVILLASHRAMKKQQQQHDSGGLEEKLREAFASRHGVELDQRRKAQREQEQQDDDSPDDKDDIS